MIQIEETPAISNTTSFGALESPLKLLHRLSQLVCVVIRSYVVGGVMLELFYRDCHDLPTRVGYVP